MKFRSFLISLILVFSLSSCNSFTEVSKTFFSFDTVFTFKAYNSEEKLLYKIEALIEKYNKLFDAFKSYEGISNIYSINETNEEIKVSEELFEALKEADFFYKESEGYFNPYIGEISFAYKKAYEENKLPNKEDISSYLSNLADFSIELNEEKQSVRRNGETKLDLGAFAKGYVTQKVKELAEELEIKYYFLNAGSSSSYFTIKPNGEEFFVGIKYLENKGINVSNASLGISSIFEQYIELDDKIYSHIINPFTGESVTQYDFSLIKSNNPIVSDVFSTIFMILKEKEKMNEFKEKFDFSYYIFKDNSVVYSTDDIEFISY